MGDANGRLCVAIFKGSDANYTDDRRRLSGSIGYLAGSVYNIDHLGVPDDVSSYRHLNCVEQIWFVCGGPTSVSSNSTASPFVQQPGVLAPLVLTQ